MCHEGAKIIPHFYIIIIYLPISFFYSFFSLFLPGFPAHSTDSPLYQEALRWVPLADSSSSRRSPSSSAGQLCRRDGTDLPRTIRHL